MINNYLKSTLRNIFKNKVFSFINILGFAIGIASSLLILQYVLFETSYNKFHENSENIYRISYSKERGGTVAFNTTLTYSGVGPILKADLPEVLEFARLRPANVTNATTVLAYEDNSYEENRAYYADPSFLKMFSFDFVSGKIESALNEQFSIVLSESMAKKYFGDENPLGKTIIQKWAYRQVADYAFNVTGVFKNVPENSHVKFDFLLSHSTLSAQLPPYWNENDLVYYHGHLYILTTPETEIDQLEAKLPKLVDDHMNGLTRKRNGVTLKLAAMPLEDIHLHSNLEHESEVNGDASTSPGLLY